MGLPGGPNRIDRPTLVLRPQPMSDDDENLTCCVPYRDRPPRTARLGFNASRGPSPRAWISLPAWPILAAVARHLSECTLQRAFGSGRHQAQSPLGRCIAFLCTERQYPYAGAFPVAHRVRYRGRGAICGSNQRRRAISQAVGWLFGADASWGRRLLEPASQTSRGFRTGPCFAALDLQDACDDVPGARPRSPGEARKAIP